MPKLVGNIVWKLLVLVISRPVASTVRDGVEKVWAASRPDNPPRTAADPDAKWLDAVIYAGLTGVGFAVGELVAQRGAAEGRSDDTEEVVRHRQQVYAEQTAPLIEVYDAQGLLLRVDGMGPVDEVTSRVFRALEQTTGATTA